MKLYELQKLLIVVNHVNNKIEELNLNKNEVGIYLAILSYEEIDDINNLFSLIDYSLAQSKLLPYAEYYILRNLNVAIGKDKWRENIRYALENDSFEIVHRKVIDIELKQKIYNGVSFNLNIKDYSYSYGTFIAPVMNLGLIEDVYLHIIKKVLLSNNAKENISTTIQLSALFINTTKQNKYNLIFEIPESFINKYYENSLLYIKLFNEYGFDFGINSFIADSEDYQYLKELKPVFVKADKQYLLDTEQNINVLKIVLESLGIKLIATGVNNIEELDSINKKEKKLISGKRVDKLD